VANHKSGVTCQFHLTVPPLATTLKKMVTQSVRMGNAHAGSLRIRRRQYTNPMSKFLSPKTFQSNKSAKIFQILVKLGLIVHKWGNQDDTKRRSRVCIVVCNVWKLYISVGAQVSTGPQPVYSVQQSQSTWSTTGEQGRTPGYPSEGVKELCPPPPAVYYPLNAKPTTVSNIGY
jgi:hypothetical protein